jgi:hypothetical protein
MSAHYAMFHPSPVFCFMQVIITGLGVSLGSTMQVIGMQLQQRGNVSIYY